MDVRICRNCILPDSMPGISFNAGGICNLCEETLARRAKGELASHQRTEADLLKSLKRSRSSYDCLCLYSGGKDSSYMLYFLTKTLGLRVLAMTLDNWFISPQTLQNIKTTLQRLGTVDHVYVKPAWDQIQKTFRSSVPRPREVSVT